MVRKILAVFAIVAALSALPAYAAEGGTIEGKLENATANGGSVEGVEVSLTTYFGQTERNKSTTKTDEQGKFQFTGLDTGTNYSYEVTSNYQKADYYGPKVSFSNSDETKQVTLKVYDSTTDESVVQASAKHYLLNVGNGEVEVTEILVLKNNTDKSYIGAREISPEQRETIRYQPPSGAKDVGYGQGLMSCCIVKEGAALLDTMPVYPGEEQKIYFYKLPYSGSSLNFSTVLQQATGNVQVLVPNTGLQANISGLSSHGTQTIQGASYLVFSGEKVPANTSLDVDLQGLPISQFGGGPIVLIGVAVGVLVALGGAFYLFRRRSQPAMAPVPSFYAPAPSPKRAQKRGPATNPALLELERRELLAGLANLDDMYEAGHISRNDYVRLRAEKKDRLVRLSQQAGAGKAPART